MTAASLQPPSPFSIFRRRTFTLMWSGQFVETIGVALTSLAASILVYRVTGGSALSVGLMLMAASAPSLFLGLIAGVFVDRYDRRKILLSADVLRAGLVLLIPLLLPYGIVWVYVIVFLIGCITQFFDPAWESILPEVAPDEELAAANSFMAISAFGSTAIGFAASGLIAASTSLNYAFYLNCVAYLVSAACIYFIRVKKIELEDETSVEVIIKNLKVGLNTLRSHPVLRSSILLGLPMALSAGFGNSLLLPFVAQALEASEFEYGIQEGMTSVGFVIASLLLAKYMNRWREGQWIVVSLIGMGLAGMAYALTRSIPIAIGIQMLSGFMNAPYSVANRLLRQRNTESEMLGRVSSGYFFTGQVFYLAGMAFAGLADIFDVRLLMFIGSGVVLVAVGLVAMRMPGIGQPAAEWRRALSLLRKAPVLPGLGTGQAVLASDVDLLVRLVPTLGGMKRIELERTLSLARILDVPEGTTLIRTGETGDTAYFILEGKAAVGIPSRQGEYQNLDTLWTSDFFGEIAALTSAARTADVVTVEKSRLMEVPASALRQLITVPAFSQLVLSRMSERLSRTTLRDLPRFSGIDPQAARGLREGPAEPDQAKTALA
jgi:MFS transporter, DHA3 family, macrolide efflux protein